MALSNVNFTRSTNGLGRALDGSDYISGLLFYTNTLPSGFGVNDRIKQVFSLSEAVALGITNTNLGATAATGTLTVTNKGSVGNTNVITIATIAGTVTLASYTQVAADIVSITTAADRISLEINLGTATHGFSATNLLGVVTITAPTSQGVYLNTISAVCTIVGTLAITVVAFSGGVGSIIDILYYHVSEYFRLQPKGNLYIGCYAEESTTYTFDALITLQNFAAGQIRQVAVYEKNVAFSNVQCTQLQVQATALEAIYKPIQIILNAEISGTANVSSLTALTGLTANNVSVVIGQDGAAIGSGYFKALGKSVGILGATLGAVSLAAVNENIGWVQKFLASSTELDTIAFSNGQLYTAISESLLTTLDTYHYIFLRKLVGLAGSYFSFSHTAIAATSDYSTIELNRVYNKITRDVRTALLPQLNSPLKVNADGTLTDATIGYFETLANRPLENMESAGELSAHKIIINPAQNVLSTSTIELTLQNVPVGVAKIINVNVGFVTAI